MADDVKKEEGMEVEKKEYLLSGGYKGPKSDYPKKTFNDGADRPTNVLREITEIPNYLDYTVFSKNQLRLAEKIFKTNTYTSNETYIRSQNFFIKLNRPGYWHKTNLDVLFKNINIVFDIMKEIITQLSTDDKRLFILPAAKNISAIITRFKDNFFNLSNIADDNGDYIAYLKKLTDYDYCIKNLFNVATGLTEINFSDIAALGVILALYNKIVSILSYVNPYVMVQKDSGVNSMVPPSFRGSNLDNYHKKMRDNLAENIEEDKISELLVVQPKNKRKVNAFKSNEKKLPDSYKKNPIIRLIQYPLYSLNILLPVTIAPVFFMKLNLRAETSYKEITKVIATTRVLARYLKINNSSFYSKVIWLDSASDENRLLVKVVITKDKINLVINRNGSSNIKYYKDLIYYVENHVFCYGEINNLGVYNHRKLQASTEGVNEEIKQEAINAKIKLKDGSDPIDSDLVAPDNIYTDIKIN